MAQMKYCQGDTLPLAEKIVVAKIKNQRAVIKHLDKYHQKEVLQSTAVKLLNYANQANKANHFQTLLGYEGASASTYFGGLRNAGLFSSSFCRREGRGSQELNNVMLNFGYAMLSAYILSSIINAGLEPYLGILHGRRPGKMALVLDLMEEYRSWVVDRVVIKLRSRIEKKQDLDVELKKALISEVQRTCARSYLY